ncbi:hypothetical protein [Micromonospora sp. NPDC002717]
MHLPEKDQALLTWQHAPARRDLKPQGAAAGGADADAADQAWRGR